jgi:hypothetical protein
VHKPSTRASRKWCQNVEPLRNQAPKSEVLGAWGAIWPRPAHKRAKHQQPINGCHVAALHWATWHLSIAQENATCRTITRPPSTNHNCHISCQGVRMSMSLYTATSGRTACPVSPFFFPVWRFEQIAITFAPDVRLRRNKLRWVRDDEGYKPICFEAIPRTLIFEVKFDPWSRF